MPRRSLSTIAVPAIPIIIDYDPRAVRSLSLGGARQQIGVLEGLDCDSFGQETNCSTVFAKRLYCPE